MLLSEKWPVNLLWNLTLFYRHFKCIENRIFVNQTACSITFTSQFIDYFFIRHVIDYLLFLKSGYKNKTIWNTIPSSYHQTSQKFISTVFEFSTSLESFSVKINLVFKPTYESTATVNLLYHSKEWIDKISLFENLVLKLPHLRVSYTQTGTKLNNKAKQGPLRVFFKLDE